MPRILTSTGLSRHTLRKDQILLQKAHVIRDTKRVRRIGTRITRMTQIEQYAVVVDVTEEKGNNGKKR